MAAGGGGGWSCLPAELLCQALERLSTDADRFHVRQVCAHWRASITPLAASRPWIVAAGAPWFGACPTSFWLPHGGQRIFEINPGGATAVFLYCCGTPRGWLALMDGFFRPGRVILWEPISKAEISLPRVSAVAQVFLSGDPLASPDWMAIINRMCPRPSDGAATRQRLSFWRPGDAAWTTQLEQPTAMIDSVAFHHRMLYVADSAWNLHAYDLGAFPPRRAWQSFFHPAMSPPVKLGLHHGLRAVHFVSCDGDLLLAMVRWGPQPALIEVHRPDWTAAPAQLRDLGERVTDLGEHSLFLGRGDAFALSAKEFPFVRRNCVYFVEHDDELKHQRWAIVFDLGSNSWEQIPYPQVRGVRWLAYSWFCPREPVLKQKDRF